MHGKTLRRSALDADPVAFPLSPARRDDARAFYAERRARSPLGRVRLPSGHDAVLVVKYADVAAALADARLSHELAAPGSPRFVAGPSILDSSNGMLNKDGPEHLRFRRLLAAAFTPRAVERRLPLIQDIATELIDDLERAGAPADLVDGFCFALPVRVICRLLGVPERDAARFRAWSQAFIGMKSFDDARLALILEFVEYAKALIARRREEPGEDLIDDLIAARDGQDRLSEDELVRSVIGLVAVGNESTSNALSRCVPTLLRDGRMLWRRLLDRPDLVPAAVDELLRCAQAGNGLLRTAVEDVDLPSGTIRKGDAVVLALESAAFDEEAYPEPESVIFDRDAPRLIVFGDGAHYCLGVSLAKAELAIGISTLLDRLPGLHLAADPRTLRYTDGEMISSLIELPVGW